MQDLSQNNNFIDNFRVIPRFEIKENYLIKGIKMEGLKKIDNIHEKITKNIKDGADELIIDDIVSSLYSRGYDIEFLKELANIIDIPIIYSGGIKTIYDIETLLKNGADKVSINSSSFINENIIYESSRIFGSQCINCHIQTKKINGRYKCFYLSGRENSNIGLENKLNRIIDLGVGEISLFSIDHDGLQRGIDMDIVENYNNINSVPILYGGGINNLTDIISLKNNNFSGCIISASLHYEDLNIKFIKDHLKENAK